MEYSIESRFCLWRQVCEKTLTTYFGNATPVMCKIKHSARKQNAEFIMPESTQAGWKIKSIYNIAEKEKRFDILWKDIIRMIDEISSWGYTNATSVSLALVDAIPHISTLGQSITTEAILPNFTELRDGIIDHETGKIKVRNDHSKDKFVEYSLGAYVRRRATQELYPKFITNPYMLLHAMLSLFIEFRDDYSFLFCDSSLLQALKNHILKWAISSNGKIESPVRITGNNPIRIVSWGTDAYFLKRMSVVLNYLVTLVAEAEFIRLYPKYTSVLTQVACYLFKSPLMHTKDFKTPHSAVLLNSFYVTRKMRPHFLRFDDSKTKITHERFGTAYIHSHPRYPEYSPADSTKLNRTFSEHIECVGCDSESSMEKVVNIKKERFNTAISDLRKLRMPEVLDFAMRFSVDPECNFGAMALMAWNHLIGMAGFSTSDAAIDITKKLEEMREWNKKTDSTDYIDNKRDLLSRANVQRNIRRAVYSLTKNAFDQGLYFRANRFKEIVPNLLTGKSAGLGTLSFNIGGKVVKVTDKKSWALIEGLRILRFSTEDAGTSSYDDWRRYFMSMGRDPDKVRIKPTLIAHHPLRQRNIAVRNVPAGRAARAVYMQTIFEYILERLIFAFIELTNRRPQGERAFNKWTNDVDQGNVNVAPNLQDTDDFLAGVIMASADPSRLILCIDYDAYDQGQTYEKILKHVFLGIRDYLEAGPEWLKETYATIDDQSANFYDLFRFYVNNVIQRWFHISRFPEVSEFLVDFLTSGAYWTFGINTTNNEMVTKEMEERACEEIQSFHTFDDVAIAGDDQAATTDLTALSSDDVSQLRGVVSSVAHAIGFKENKDKTDMSVHKAEMAKIFFYRGTTIRIGSVQLFESEKASQASTIFETVRGFHQLVKIFMYRYPADTRLLASIGIITGTIACQLDAVDKRETQERQVIVLDPYIQIVPSSFGVGCGATLTGFQNNELVYHFYSAHREMFLAYVDLASQIRFKKLEGEQRKLVDTIFGKIQHEETITVFRPDGTEIFDGMRGARDMLSVNKKKLEQSAVANRELLRMKIKVPKNMLLENATKSFVEQITATMNLDPVRLRGDSSDLLLNLESYVMDADHGYTLVCSQQPLLQGMSLQATSNPVMPRKYTLSRYPTVSTGLREIQKYVGDRHNVQPPKNPALLTAIRNALAAGRRETVISPNITEETFLDIILDIITSVRYQNINLYDIIRNIIRVFFGILIDERKYVDALLYTINSNQVSAIPYSLSGSFMVYLDVNYFPHSDYIYIPAKSVYKMHYTYIAATLFMSRLADGYPATKVALNNDDLLRKDTRLMPISKAYDVKAQFPSHGFAAFE
ncbi:RNA-directed RNA polymerase [Nephila clavipes virus 6]|uniref:RNA-directed RNA polymerase n=1 Tax=Nephila clavipes virus 6 TaxID=2108203 RepID=UPI000D20E2B4|nr:RNA-directed RNA polymerase [Nephila clavipes virus 6]AVK59488.1 RNA-directed RNA polymerase [Nephila clavipes virus 6]